MCNIDICMYFFLLAILVIQNLDQVKFNDNLINIPHMFALFYVDVIEYNLVLMCFVY